MNPLWILVEREFRARVAKKGYWLFTLFGLLIMVALTFLPSIINTLSSSTRDTVVVNDPKGIIAPVLTQSSKANSDTLSYKLQVMNAPDLGRETNAELANWMKQEGTHLLVLVSGNTPSAASFTVVQQGSVDPSVFNDVKTALLDVVNQSRVAALDEAAQQSLRAPIPMSVKQLPGTKSFTEEIQSQVLVDFMLALLMMTIIVYGQWVAQGIIEEKSNRIIEMILTTARPWQVLFGKVIGLGLVALVQYAVWTTGVVTTLLFQHSFGAVPVHQVSAMTLFSFPVFFILGYLLYATLFAIGGSLVHRVEEQQIAITPIALLLAVVFYASVFVLPNPDSTYAVVVSFIPVFTPLAMFARIALGTVPLWQTGISIVLTLFSIWLLVRVGASVYGRFALRTSGKASWKLLWKGNQDRKRAEEEA